MEIDFEFPKYSHSPASVIDEPENGNIIYLTGGA
jgi:hypothetical protein